MPPRPRARARVRRRPRLRLRLLYGVYRLDRRAAGWVVAALVALSAAALLSLRDLTVDSSFSGLLPEGDPVLEKFRKYEGALRETESITVLLRLRERELGPERPGAGVARLLGAAQRLVERLEAHPEITKATYRREQPALPALPVNLLTMSEESLQALKRAVAELQSASKRPSLLGATERPLPDVYAQINQAIEELFSGLAVFNPPKLAEALKTLKTHLENVRALNAELVRALEALPEELEAARRGLDELDRLVRSWQSALQPRPSSASAADEAYLLSRDKRALLVQVYPRQPAHLSLEYNRKIVQFIRRTLRELDLSAQGIEWGMKGPYVFSVETDDVLRRDMNRTALITLVGVFALFVIVLKRLFYPLLATLPVLAALVVTLAGATWAFGGLNLLTAFLPAIVLGLGIDYGIQFISHYLEERQGARRPAAALRATMLRKGNAMLVAALVTASVLFGLSAVARSPGLAQMGVILGLGVLLSCLFTLVGLPALVLTAVGALGRGRAAPARPPRPWNLSGLARAVVRGRWPIVVGALLGSAALLGPAQGVRFAFVTEALMPTDLQSQRTRAYILEHFEFEREVPDPENYFLFFVPDDERLVRRVARALLQIEAIDEVTSYYSFIPPPREREAIQARLQQLRALDPVGPLQEIARRLRAVQAQLGHRDALLDVLGELEEQLRDRSDEVLAATGDAELARELRDLAESTRALRERVERLDATALSDRIQVLRVDVEALVERVRAIVAAIPPPDVLDRLVENPPPEIQKRFFTPDGKTIIYAHVQPEWLWNSVKYDRFIHQISAVWGDYLGQPMIRATLERYMKQDFWRSTGLAVLVILLVLGLEFARGGLLGAAAVSLLTIGLGYLWLLGTMGWLGIDFNVANVLISPLLIGLGVDNCVYLLARFRDFGGRSVGAIERALASTALPILANTLATMIGFGSLMLAETPVLRVLGESAVMGIGFMTLLGLTFLPAVLALGAARR